MKKVITYKEFIELKNRFFENHDNKYDYHLGEKKYRGKFYGGQTKRYTFLNGAEWYEELKTIYEEIEHDIEELKVVVTANIALQQITAVVNGVTIYCFKEI